MHDISHVITLFTPILSGVYLFTALYWISKSVGNNSQIDIKAMTLHATSFGLYMVSVLLFIYIYVMSVTTQNTSTKTYVTFWGITYICSCLSQAVLCMIFWDLGKKKEPRQARKKQEQPLAIVSNEDNQGQDRIHRYSLKKQEHPSSVVNYDSDESEEEPETIYNSAEARRLFRI